MGAEHSRITFWSRALGGAQLGCALLLALVLASCGGSVGGSGSGGSAGPIPETEFASRYAQIFCDALNRCCAQAGYAHGDETTCKAEATFKKSTYGSYQPQAGGECIQALTQVLSGCPTLAALTTSAALEPCNRVYAGQAPGQPCGFADECVPGPAGTTTVCLVEPSGNSSRCAHVVHARAGDPCYATADSTGHGDVVIASGNGGVCFTSDGLYCAPDGHCASLVGVGGACNGLPVCVASAYCDDASGKCALLQPLGAPCTSSMLGPGECVSGTTCDDVTNTCITPRPVGAACQDDGECAGFNCQQGKCSASFAQADSCAQAFAGAAPPSSSASSGTGGAAP